MWKGLRVLKDEQEREKGRREKGRLSKEGNDVGKVLEKEQRGDHQT